MTKKKYRVFESSNYKGEPEECLVIYNEYIDHGVSYVLENNIKSVHFSSHANDYSSKKQNIDFSFLAKIKEITSFSNAVPLSKKSSVDYIYELKKLKDLTWGEKNIVLDLSFFEDLESMTCETTFSFINYQKLLKIRYFYFSTKDCDLSILSKMPSLEKVIIGFSKITTCDGIENLHALKDVIIHNCPLLESVAGLNLLPSLENLGFESMKLLDYSELGTNKHIKELGLMTTVDSIEFISKMNSLEDVFIHKILSGDLNPLIDSKSLKKVLLHPERRRNYSHSLDEINKILSERLG